MCVYRDLDQPKVVAFFDFIVALQLYSVKLWKIKFE